MIVDTNLPSFELILLSKNKSVYNLTDNTLSDGTFIKDYYKGLAELKNSIKNYLAFKEIYIYIQKIINVLSMIQIMI